MPRRRASFCFRPARGNGPGAHLSTFQPLNLSTPQLLAQTAAARKAPLLETALRCLQNKRKTRNQPVSHIFRKFLERRARTAVSLLRLRRFGRLHVFRILLFLLACVARIFFVPGSRPFHSGDVENARGPSPLSPAREAATELGLSRIYADYLDACAQRRQRHWQPRSSGGNRFPSGLRWSSLCCANC
ncbi:hypothetical protein BH20VER1_BH20VER1_27150 [soil metagenome]